MNYLHYGSNRHHLHEACRQADRSASFHFSDLIFQIIPHSFYFLEALVKVVLLLLIYTDI
jgi:hypothetical protein